MLKRFFLVLLVCLMTVAGPLCAYAANSPAEAKKTINEVFDYIYHTHLSKPDLQQLMQSAVWGMIDSLDDPYTYFFTADELKEFTGSINGDFEGIGIYLEAQPDYPRVNSVLENSPAMKAGIKAGDIIKSIDGNDIKGWNISSVVDKIKGPADSEVHLGIGRDGTDIDLILKRALLSMPTVESKILAGNMGYISVSSFGTKTSQEFKAALTRLLQQNIRSLVIDLRNNPGGYFLAALEMSEFFLEPNDLIAGMEDNSGVLEQYFAEENGLEINIPIAVVINSYSASASELMAAALQDNKVAVLIGEQSYGKGVVQSMITLEQGDALKITTGEYITPKGRHLDKVGLPPDYSVGTDELRIPFALKILQPGPSTVAYTLQSREVMVNGEKVISRNVPLSREEICYLPLRFTFEALGYVVSWEKTTRSIFAEKNNTRIMIPFNGNPSLNGREIKTNSRLVSENESSYIPIDMIKAFGIACTEEEGRIVLEDTKAVIGN